MKNTIVLFVYSVLIFLCSTTLGAQPVLFTGHRPLSLPTSSRISSATKPVLYYGGNVISHVKIYVIFWGNNVEATTKANIGPFYEAVVNSGYIDQLAEYGTSIKATDGREGTHQEIGRGTLAGIYTINPSNSSLTIDQAGVEHEIEGQLNSGVLPSPDENSLYMIYFPPGMKISISFGVSCSSWLADHEYYNSKKFGNIYYSMMPDIGTCGFGGTSAENFDTLTVSSSHELAEAITDPMCPLANIPSAYPAAWINSDQYEVGDLCAWKITTVTTPTAKYSVQQEWLNSLMMCNPAQF